MTIEADRAVLDDAWGHIPQSRDIAEGMGSFTRVRVDRIISLVVGLGCLVLGAQAFIAALQPGDELPGWHVPLVASNFIVLAIMLIACAFGRLVRVFAGAFAIVFLLTLVVWPLATAGTVPELGSQPWMWYLVNVATAAAMLSFPLAWQVIWTLLIPLVFGFVRLVEVGFEQEWIFPTILDVSFALIFGGVLTTLGWVFRSVAVNVDRTRARAVASYAQAASAEATEQERVAVAALMHDSVLAALIAAERATTPRARTLAVSMAREALTRLANTDRDATEGSDAPVDISEIADEIERSTGEPGWVLAVSREIEPGTPPIPGRIARALVLAAAQAISNSRQHANGVGLRASVLGRVDPRSIAITVKDAGQGFVVDEIPQDRLGIRASIYARVAAVGGVAHIDSGPSGTTVILTWAGE